jgi:surface protein
MTDNNSVRVGDVSDTDDGINVKDLLHLSDVIDNRSSATANSNLYDINEDSTISQQDADDLYDILRGDKPAPGAIQRVEFKWIYNEEHDDRFLQIKNWNGYQNFVEMGVVSEYANVYWFYENTFNALGEDESDLIMRPSVADNYPFEKNFDVDEDTHIEFILQEGVYRLYINGFPAIMYPDGDGDQVKLDDANPPVYADGETQSGYYPLFKKSMTSFVSTWQVNSDSLKIELPLGENSQWPINQFSVDYGDNTPVFYVGDTETSEKVSHTYAQAGSYEIKITGKLKTWSFNNNEMSSNITNISSWGCLDLTTTTHQFDGCVNLDVTATDYPTIGNNTSLECCFQNCSSLTGGVSNWKVKTVVNFEKMFNGCVNFNDDVSNWDTSSATNMISMFMNASSFNIDVNTKQIGNETAWDVSKVTDANRMFAGCTFYDQSIHLWNISIIQNMELIFNQVTLSLCNYVKMIRNWAGLIFENNNIKFGASSCKYDHATQSYRIRLQQSVDITDDGIDAENVCEGSVLYATLVNPTLAHLNSGNDLMDSRQWQTVADDAYEALFLPFYDIDYQLSKSLYDAENNKLSDHVNVNNKPYLMFDVTFENSTYNYEHTWSIDIGTVLIIDGPVTSNWKTTLETQYPTASIVDNITEIDSLDATTTTKIIIPVRNLYVATVEDYISMDRPLPTQLPWPGEHMYVFRKNETSNNIINSEKVRVDNFDLGYVTANFAGDPRTMCMYVDNGLSGMMVYMVRRTPTDAKDDRIQETVNIEVVMKTSGVWKDARKIEDIIPEISQSTLMPNIKKNGKIVYCSHIKKLLLHYHTGCIWLNYDDVSNSLSYHLDITLRGDHDFPASTYSTFIDANQNLDLLYEDGIRKFSDSGYSEKLTVEYPIPGVCRDPHIRYNRKNDTIEVTYFTSVDTWIPFSGNLVCVKDSYTLDQTLRPQKVTSSTMTKKVVDETGESIYPQLFPNLGDQRYSNSSDDYACVSIFPVGASDDVNSIYFPTEYYWNVGSDRLPLLYHNTETNHTQSFELECGMLLYACVSHGVLITLEYDEEPPPAEGGVWGEQMWNNTYIRFTEINTSDPANIQLSQIGERKNIKDMGFQVPTDGIDPVDRTIMYEEMHSFGINGIGDWLSVAPNANKDIFSVLIT